jgi:pyruvate dehydrogenase E1 component alpha subunit/2-oxoisovalerate dehydrogenase E1 component
VSTKPRLDHAHLRHLLHQMVRIRRFEAKCVELYQAQRILGFLHLCDGEEAVSVGVMQALGPQDAVVATYREHGQALARGLRMGPVLAEMLGLEQGSSRGRGGSMHIFDRAARFFGEGAVDEGAFHETMNLAALWKLPMLFVCENNLYSMGTAVALAEAETNIARKAEGYRMPARQIDGMDVVAMEVAARAAVAAIRAGGGPQFLECRTYRFRAHSMFDAQSYRTREEVEAWRARDPILRLRTWLLENGLLHAPEIAAVEAEADAEVAAALAEAESGTPEPVEHLERFVTMDEVPA